MRNPSCVASRIRRMRGWGCGIGGARDGNGMVDGLARLFVRTPTRDGCDWAGAGDGPFTTGMGRLGVGAWSWMRLGGCRRRCACGWMDPQGSLSDPWDRYKLGGLHDIKLTSRMPTRAPRADPVGDVIHMTWRMQVQIRQTTSFIDYSIEAGILLGKCKS